MLGSKHKLPIIGRKVIFGYDCGIIYTKAEGQEGVTYGKADFIG